MEIVRRAHSMREICRKARANGRTIGFVPTMGSLHRGHLSLIRRLKEMTDLVVVSIFVNPTQFDEAADLERYPRDLAGDVDRCVAEEVDYVFAPAPAELYPEGASTWIEVGGLSSTIEGAARPGHFRGVTTVVGKLFNIVVPTVAAFGQKDAQQAAIVRRMIRDLMFDVELLVLPTVRDDDGVALSSRNAHLTDEQRTAARAIPAAINAAREAVDRGERHAERIVDAARESIDAEPLLEVDYIELVRAEDLEPVEQAEGELLLLLAVRAGEIRLLDNAALSA